MKKTWQETLEGKPYFPKVPRLDKGFSCRDAVHEIRLAWRLSVYTRGLSYRYKR